MALLDGRETYIYILFEHKSYPDRLIALQLLRYMVRIWEQALKQEQDLLPILPLVLYHGRAKWSVRLELAALFDLPEVLRPYLPDYRYWLCDLSQYDDAEIKGAVTLRVGLLLLKYILRDDLEERLGEILGLLRTLSQQQTGLEYIETLLRYVSGGTDQISQARLEQVVREVFVEGDKLMSTIAEQWIEQGRAEGLEKGREATLNVLRHFLHHRFGAPLDHFDEAFAGLDLAALTHLSDTAFEVETLPEFETRLAKLRADNQQDEGLS